MHRFYCPDPPLKALKPVNLSEAAVELDRDQTHHAQKSLRLAPGNTVGIFDGRGTVATGQIQYKSNRAWIRITTIREIPPLQPVIHIASAVPKGPRAGDMMNQLGQLGADRYTPLQTTRSVVHPRPGKLEQFARIAIESAKQSNRAYLMKIDPLTTLDTVLAQPHDLCRIAHLASPTQPPVQGAPTITDRINRSKNALILIGPEGGWTDEEYQAAINANCVPWRLGPNILRIETAAPAAVAIMRSLA